MPTLEPDLLTAEERAALHRLADALWDQRGQIAAEWARRLVAASPDLNALLDLVTGLNDRVLELVLTHCRDGDFGRLYTAYYERMYELVEADLQVGRLPESTLHIQHLSARISCAVIGEQAPVSSLMMFAYTKLALGLVMLADQAHAACHHAFFQRAQELAAAAGRRNDQILAVLAHELRNPLAAIRNAAAILEHENTEPTSARQATTIISGQLDHIARLVDDLYDMSRMTHGKIEFQCSFVELATAVTTAVESARHLIEARQQRLDVRLPQNPVRLYVDPMRLVQIVSNLLTNAARYTDEGGEIALVATCGPREARIEVTDTGIGVAPEMLPHIFDPFVQVASERRPEGLGIGLALVRALVEMHGGTIAATSPGVGKGSTFVVRLPMQPV